MSVERPQLQVRLAHDERDQRSAQRLRYRVFVQELGASGPYVDHSAQLEKDNYDALCDHLLLIDPNRDAQALDDVVGVYRLLPGDRLEPGQAFYSEGEFDLTALRQSGRSLLELGRSCVHPDYRGGTAMFHLWSALADYVIDRRIEVLFGVASFHGTDLTALAQPLAYLHRNHLAPEAMRVRAAGAGAVPMDRVGVAAIDRKAAMLATPALIKAYLRLGGFVGEGAFVDAAFNTVDVCLVMDTARLSAQQVARYRSKPEGPK